MRNRLLYRPMPACARVENKSICFQVTDHPMEQYYSLTDVQVKGFNTRQGGTPVKFENIDQWAFIPEGIRAGWWRPTNKEIGTTSTLASAPFTVQKTGMFRFDWQTDIVGVSSRFTYVLAKTDGTIIAQRNISSVGIPFSFAIRLEPGTYTITFTFLKGESRYFKWDNMCYVKTPLLYDGNLPLGCISIRWPQGLFMYEQANTAQGSWTQGGLTSTSLWYTIGKNDDNNALVRYLEGLRFAYDTPVEGLIHVCAFDNTDPPQFFDKAGRQHYYSYVSNPVTWMQAYNLAKNTKRHGLTGYLATSTSAQENAILLNLSGRNNGWIGGTRMTLPSGARLLDPPHVNEDMDAYDIQPDGWYWCDGPEAGKVFTVGKKVPVTIPPGLYTDWITDEPNNEWENEAALMIKIKQPGSWNDEPPLKTDYINGYYVEFSPYGPQRDESALCVSAPLPAVCGCGCPC